MTSSRPKGRHRKVEPKTRGNAATVVAVAVVGGTAISASATSSSTPTHATQAQESADESAKSRAAAAAKSEADARRAAQAKAAKLAAAKQKAAKQAAERAAIRARHARQARIAAAHRWVVPMKTYQFTSEFGPRWGHLHAGIDLAAPIGTPVQSMSTGVVTFAGQKNGYGTALVIEYWDGTKSLYGHLDAIHVKVGQHVAPGQTVALAGNTGHSTGPHLHMEIRPKSSLANTMARAPRHRGPQTSSLVAMASNDAMARAGVEPAPVDPVPWMRAHRILPRGAH